MKKVISLILALVMALGIPILPKTALAEKENDIFENAEYASSINEAAAILRDGLIAREKTINIYMPSISANDDVIRANTVMDRALSNDSSTGANTGDYLYLNSVGTHTIGTRTESKSNKEFCIMTFEVLKYNTTKEQEEAVDKRIDEILPSLIGYNDFQTVKNIHDYICENTTYDWESVDSDSQENQTAYAGLFEHKFVCGGYASLFYRMAMQANIEARTVNCAAMNHIWNAVKLYGKWYYVDCTWDDVDDAKNSDYSTVTKQETSYWFFLRGEKDFTNHRTYNNYSFGSGEGSKPAKSEFAEYHYEYPYLDEPLYKEVENDGKDYWELSEGANCWEGDYTATHYDSNNQLIETVYVDPYPSKPVHYITETVVKLPTHTEEGSVQTYCPICGDPIETKVLTVAAEHEFEYQKTVKPSCKGEGYDLYKCKYCSETEKRNIKEKAHRYVLQTVNPTCTEDGYEAEICESCGETINVKKLNKLGHNSISLEALEPSCDYCGYSEGEYCTRCKTIIKKREKLSEKAHAWNEGLITEKASCTSQGKKLCTCSVCGITKEAVIPVNPHNWDSGIITKRATPTSTGIKRFTCKDCSVARDTVIPKTPKYRNTLAIKAKAVTVKLKKLKKKNQNIALKNAMTVSNAKGKLTCSKQSGNKKISVSKNGRITVKKGLKKGTYKLRIKITASGNASYEAISKTITVKIKVK